MQVHSVNSASSVGIGEVHTVTATLPYLINIINIIN